MNKMISVLKNLRLRQILTVFIAGLTIFVMQAFSNVLPAQADETVKSPYGYYYKGTPDENVVDRDVNIRGDRQIENARQKLSNTAEDAKQGFSKTAENVREKLNLDEEPPQATKDFLKSTKEKIEETVESITGQQNQPQN